MKFRFQIVSLIKRGRKVTIEELDELIKEIETDYEKSQQIVGHTFVVKKIKETKVELILSGLEDDKMLFNRIDSNIPAIEIADIKEIYHIVGSNNLGIDYSLIEVPFKELDEFYFTCTSVAKGKPYVIYERTNKAIELLNKLCIGDYAILILKEE